MRGGVSSNHKPVAASGSSSTITVNGRSTSVPYTEGVPEMATVLTKIVSTVDTYASHPTKGVKLASYIDTGDSLYTPETNSGNFQLIFHNDTDGLLGIGPHMNNGLSVTSTNGKIQISTLKEHRFDGWTPRNDNGDGRNNLQAVVEDLKKPDKLKPFSDSDSQAAFADLAELMLSTEHGVKKAAGRNIPWSWDGEYNPEVPNKFGTFLKEHIKSLLTKIKDSKGTIEKAEHLDDLTNLYNRFRYRADGTERFSYQELSGIIKDATTVKDASGAITTAGKENMVELLLDLKSGEIAEAKALPNPKAQIQHLETIFAGIRESVLRKDAKGNLIPEPGLEKDYLAAYNRVLKDFFPAAPSAASYVLKNGMPDVFDNAPGSEIEKFVASLPKPAKPAPAAKVTPSPDSSLGKLMGYKLTRPASNASAEDKTKYADQLQVLAILKRYFSDMQNGEDTLSSLLSSNSIPVGNQLKADVMKLLKGYTIDNLDDTIKTILTAVKSK